MDLAISKAKETGVGWVTVRYLGSNLWQKIKNDKTD